MAACNPPQRKEEIDSGASSAGNVNYEPRQGDRSGEGESVGQGENVRDIERDGEVPEEDRELVWRISTEVAHSADITLNLITPSTIPLSNSPKPRLACKILST